MYKEAARRRTCRLAALPEALDLSHSLTSLALGVDFPVHTQSGYRRALQDSVIYVTKSKPTTPPVGSRPRHAVGYRRQNGLDASAIASQRLTPMSLRM